MNGKGIFVGQSRQSQPRSSLAGKTLKTCNRKGRTKNIVVIDVDCDDYDDAIFVDVQPDSSSNGSRKNDKYSFATVICIDDDEEDYGETHKNNPNKCRHVQENSTPVKLSKCKRTYSGTASTSNCYGFSTDTDSVSSSSSSSSPPDDDDDDNDLEFEGFSGKLQQEWEKAFLRRRNEVFSSVDEAGTSRICPDGHRGIRTGDKTQIYSGGLDSASCTSHEEVNRCLSTPMDIDNSESILGCETSTFDRVNNVCNVQSLASEFAGTSHIRTDIQLVEANDVSNGQSSGDKCNGVFFNREMHKETDAYRRSVEAELEARQRELKIQAEEAQHLKRLRKRKREKALRLLDMERRQKLRVEEMRKTQKKDEENSNLKVQLRAEVRKDLDRLEASCHDMTSILRGLGINVNGVNGVHVAFKKALLTFHPDRASQSDIRLQVEAEEKFKLINRMKEKYLSTL